jgi:hypothetical protein
LALTLPERTGITGSEINAMTNNGATASKIVNMVVSSW